jgi:hypothetical protein
LMFLFKVVASSSIESTSILYTPAHLERHQNSSNICWAIS